MDVAISGGVGAQDTAFARVPEAAFGAENWTFFRSKYLNLLRFASILVGAGLLLRVGAAEQANSAIDDGKAAAAKPRTTRITMPQPAFGHQADSSGNAAIAKTSATLPAITPAIAKAAQARGKGNSLRTETPTPAFAAAFGSALDSAAAPVISWVANSELGANVRSHLGATKFKPGGRSPAKSLDATRLALSGDAPATGAVLVATPGTALRSKPAMASKPAQAISFTSRRATAEGLLAPVRITSASGGSLLAPVRAAPAGVGAGSANTALVFSVPDTVARRSAGPVLAGSTLAGAASVAVARTGKAPLAPAARQALVSDAPSVQAAASAPATRLPVGAALVNARPQPSALAPAAANPIASPVIAQPVQISLAAPVMTRGPRTTLRTSILSDVMRRPASAWDYAEGLSPEMAGAAQRNAGVQPAGALLPVQTASSPAAPRQITAGPARRVLDAQPVQIAPTRAEMAPGERTVAVQSQAADPVGAKIVLAQRQAPQFSTAALADEQRVAVRSPARRALPVRALGASPVNVATLYFKRKEDEFEVIVQQNARGDINFQSASGSAAAESVPETTILSLLDRMPHPAF